MNAHRVTRPDSRAQLGRYMTDLRDALERAGVAQGQDFYVVPAAELDGDDGRVTLDGPSLALAHAGDPSTSKRAAFDNYPRAGSHRLKVFEAVARYPNGLTAEECADKTGLRSTASGNSAAKRLSEPRQGGWVAPSGRTRRTSNGSDAEVLVLTEKGRAEWERRRLTWDSQRARMVAA